jgi:hypothetical protein
MPRSKMPLEMRTRGFRGRVDGVEIAREGSVKIAVVETVQREWSWVESCSWPGFLAGE